MIKLWSRICFLVLAISTISRGQNKTTISSETTATSTQLPDKNETDAPDLMLSIPIPSANSTALTEDDTGNTLETFNSSNTTEEVISSTAAPLTSADSVQRTTPTDGDITTVSMTTGSAPSKPGRSSSWAYVLLVLIILVIIILCVILYFLRRVSRTYSFDLQRPNLDRFNEPTGTFEPVYLDDLDRPVPNDQVTTDDLSPPPVANGTTLPSEEKGSSGESAPQEQPEANGVESSPVTNTSPSSDDDSPDKAPTPSNSTSLFLDAAGEEQQNENNNNPSVCSSDPFVEINLDEPAWCDQLLTSPEATSSVLPFSPFSFSSSSSSSSSS